MSARARRRAFVADGPDREAPRYVTPPRWWVPWAALVIPLAVLAVQDTRWSILPADREPALWATVLLALVGAIVLRAGWLHESRTARRQEELFTASNSFYEPRRRAMTESGAVVGGLAGALWWGVTTWIVLGHALWRGAGARGLFELETAVIVGAIAGTIGGAVLGRAAGWVWERRHRRRRMRVVRGARARR